MIKTFERIDLPDWVKIPKKYFQLVQSENDEFLPWYLLEREQFLIRYEGMKRRFPDRELVPFARHNDTDDVACWDSINPDAVYIIHDFASPGYEQRKIFNSFDKWYDFALREMKNY